MAHPVDPALERDILQVIRRVDNDRIDKLACKIDELTEFVQHAHRHEMAKIDSETNALAAQIEEIAGGMSDAEHAEQVRRLKALASTLNAIGKPAATPPTIPVP